MSEEVSTGTFEGRTFQAEAQQTKAIEIGTSLAYIDTEMRMEPRPAHLDTVTTVTTLDFIYGKH